MTKQSYFWATPSGPINLIEGDKYPDGSDYAENFTDRSGEGRYDHAGYEAAIQAAKESSVPIQDQEKAAHMIHQRYELKRGEVYGPFTVGYEIQELHYCKLCGAYKSIKRIPCQNAYCGKTTERVAILYDDTPEKEHSSLREALREVKAKNRELRDSYNDPTRLDFRIKDSRGFPTGEVVDEAKVVPEKEAQEQIFDDMFCKYFDYIYQEKKSSYHACLEIQKEFTITRKQ